MQPRAVGGVRRVERHRIYDRCDGDLYWAAPDEFPEPYEIEDGKVVKGKKSKGKTRAERGESGPNFYVQLDDDGNATAVVAGGPSCAAGESLISAHLVEAPYETFTTNFTVLPPATSTPGVTLTPATSIEDDVTSSVGTIANVEFPPVYAEHYVNLNAAQLADRCLIEPKLLVLRARGLLPRSGRGTARPAVSTMTATRSCS